MKTDFNFAKTFAAVSAAAACISVSSCTKNEVNAPQIPSKTVSVKAELSAYEGSGLLLEGENVINDLQACIFEDGRLSRVYDNIEVSGTSADLQIDSHSGTLYLLANTAGQIDVSSLLESGITEEEWLRRTVSIGHDGPVHFFTGKAGLDDRNTVVPVSLTRGVARFDLQVRTAGDAEVKSLTLKNSAESAFLFPVTGELSPSDVTRNDASVSFSQPLTADTPGVLYVYEQAADGLEITVDAVVDGKPVVLTKKLSDGIERNTVYTVTVRKDVIDVTLEVSFEDWIPGTDTELVPQNRQV